jgi:hypothetical protein
VAERRERWIAGQAGLDPTRLVFIDETGTNTKMARRYGRCPIGQRLVGKVPWGHWLTTTFTCGLRCDGKGPAAHLRRLELGSNTRCRAGAAVKNTSEYASSS